MAVTGSIDPLSLALVKEAFVASAGYRPARAAAAPDGAIEEAEPWQRLERALRTFVHTFERPTDAVAALRTILERHDRAPDPCDAGVQAAAPVRRNASDTTPAPPDDIALARALFGP